jgi:A/G-specific adenine glycosylase
MREIVALGPPGDLVQAMMDLGATICSPTAPRCGDCPLSEACRALATGDPEAFPARKTKKPRPQRFGTAYWIERDGAIWLVRRAPSGPLGGMAALPGGDWSIDDRSDRPLASVRHVFTHFALELAVVERPDPIGAGWWHPLDEIADAGLPTLYRKAVAAVLESRASRAARAA